MAEEQNAETACPTCGPTTTEPHPNQTGIVRCANCKEWLHAPPGSAVRHPRPKCGHSPGHEGVWVYDAYLYNCHVELGDQGSAEQDAPDLWISDPLPGGFVCSVCQMPVESEPCAEHQPGARHMADAPTLRAEPYNPATDCSCPPPHRGDRAPNPECVEHGTQPAKPTARPEGRP